MVSPRARLKAFELGHGQSHLVYETHQLLDTGSPLFQIRFGRNFRERPGVVSAGEIESRFSVCSMTILKVNITPQ